MPGNDSAPANIVAGHFYNGGLKMHDLVATIEDKEAPLLVRINAAYSLIENAKEVYRNLCSLNRQEKNSDKLIAEYIANNGIAKYDSDVSGIETKPLRHDPKKVVKDRYSLLTTKRPSIKVEKPKKEKRERFSF